VTSRQLLDLLDNVLTRTPRDKLIRDWCKARDSGDIDAWEEIELELEEFEEREDAS
jgi:hypothetical protein